MNKKIAFISTIFISSLLTGCNLLGSSGGGNIDDTKTQIGISNWGGGYGTEWLKSVTEQYAELVKDKSFEDGKKGVQFVLNQEKEHHDTADKINGLTSIDIVFDEGVQYNMWQGQNVFKDITEVLTEANPYDNNKKIIDKMSSEQKAALNKNDKYYAIPGYAGSWGIVYNKELMDANGGLYFKEGGGFTTSSGNRTVGPDGVANTYDDGLPSTFEELLTLCQAAKGKNLVPMICSGSSADTYLPATLNNLAASYDGKDVVLGRLTCTANNVTVVDLEDKTKTEVINVTQENGYELHRTEGLYKAFNFFEQLLAKGYMIDSNNNKSTIFDDGVTNLAAQKYFLNECPNGKKALMLIEGDWWFNEAEEYVEEKYGSDLSSANYGFLAFPSKDGESYRYNSLADYCYVRKGSDNAKWEAVKDFLFYCFSDQALNNFTKITNTKWNLNYTMDAEVKASLNPFGQSLVDFYESEHNHFVEPISQDPFFIANEGIIQPYHSTYIQISYSKNIINFLNGQATAGYEQTAHGYIKLLHKTWQDKNIWTK